MMIPDPRFATLRDWADQMVLNITSDVVPILADETRWREWGEVVVTLPSLLSSSYPQPNGYGSWDAWAQALWLADATPQGSS